jgi:uncharacterized protein
MTDDDNAALASAARKYWSSEGYTAGGVIREVDYAASSKGLHPALKGIKIVDCDTHFTEPPDLFTSRAPAKFKEKVPQVRRVAGVDRWFVGDRDFGSLGGNVIRADNNKLLGRLAFPTIDEGHQAAHNVKARLRAMDDMGVYAQICYQNSGVTQAGSLMSLGDMELAETIIRIYNDAAAERQAESGQRLFTLGHLPLWDPAAMLAEARRCLDLGLKGFVLPDTPERLGIPSFLHDYWTPFLEMCADRGVPINFHLNAAMDPNTLTWEGFAFEQTLSVVATMFSIGNAATLGNWIVSGRLDLEHQFDEMLPSKSKMLQRRPWDYFRDQFWVTYWFESVGPKLLLNTVGVNKVLFETDFPHPTSLYPGVQEHIVDTLGGYDQHVRKRVLERNAVELYNLPF